MDPFQERPYRNKYLFKSNKSFFKIDIAFAMSKEQSDSEKKLACLKIEYSLKRWR